jgi:hypothetical protein
MAVLIEKYRGHEIYFNTSDESFYCDGIHDYLSRVRKSFSAIRKDIDEYIKHNQKFEPFDAISIGTMGIGDKITITGIRKDGRFVYDDGDGKSQQLSDYDIKSYFVYNEKDEPIYSAIRANDVSKQEFIRQFNQKNKELLLQLRVENIKSRKPETL